MVRSIWSSWYGVSLPHAAGICVPHDPLVCALQQAVANREERAFEIDVEDILAVSHLIDLISCSVALTAASLDAALWG